MIWFGGKPKNNRRLGHEHVLDVKLRSDQVRATRTRLGALALALVFGTIFGFYLVWHAGAWALNRLIYENNAFAIQEIDVHTDGVIAPDQLRRWAGVKLGENLLALDLARVKRDLEMVSTIKSVAVERVLPDTLRMRVIGARPARADLCAAGDCGRRHSNDHPPSGRGRLRDDAAGSAAAAPTPPRRYQRRAAGDHRHQHRAVVPGTQVESSQVRSALKLLYAFGHSPMAGIVDLRQVDVSSPEVLVARTSEGSEVTFSLRDFDRQLRRWREIYDQGQRLSKAVASVDLSVSNNIPVPWAGRKQRSVPPPVPRTKNLQHTRKRNV